MPEENEMKARLTALIDESLHLELNVSTLYFLFYNLFPQDAAFWWRLTEEEKNHAALIRSGKEYFAPLGNFPDRLLHDNADELKATNARVLSLIEKYKTSPPSRAEALNCALTLETSAGELHFQKFMDGKEGSAIDKIFRELNGEDEAHAKRIKAYMIKNDIPVHPVAGRK
jgi:hypothetical protein